MDQNDTLISIILPIFNAEKFLADCLTSLLSQSYANIEIIAIDDCSRDNSWRILRQFKKQDKRLRIFRNVKRYGIAISCNRALRKAKGEFFAFTRATDVSRKHRLREQLQFLLASPKSVAVGTQCIFVDKEGKQLEKSNFPFEAKQILQKSLHLHSLTAQFETLMVNKLRIPKDVLKFSKQRKNLMYSFLLFKLAAYGTIHNLASHVYIYRQTHRKKSIRSMRTFGLSIKMWLRSLPFSPIQSTFSS